MGSASCLVGDCLDEEVPQGVAGLSTRCLDLGLPPPFQPLPRQAFLEGRWGAGVSGLFLEAAIDCSLQTPPWECQIHGAGRFCP